MAGKAAWTITWRWARSCSQQDSSPTLCLTSMPPWVSGPKRAISLPMHCHVNKPSSSGQMEIPRTTWPITGEPRCIWPWASPSRRCRIWAESSNSNRTSHLWVSHFQIGNDWDSQYNCCHHNNFINPPFKSWLKMTYWSLKLEKAKEKQNTLLVLMATIYIFIQLMGCNKLVF